MRVVKRQVFDLPPLRLVVTGHLAEVKACPGGGQIHQAEFPVGISQLAHNGPGFKAVLTYLNQKHCIPLEPVNELCEDVFQHPVGAGTNVAANAQVAEAVEPVNQRASQYLIKTEETVCFDESGLCWLLCTIFRRRLTITWPSAMFAWSS
jgi:hypothetical protein